eukprot:10428837-Alexandrium_andersonii.AAC.1
MVDIAVERTPIGARRATDEEVGTLRFNQLDGQVAALPPAEVPETAVQDRAEVERPNRQDPKPRIASCRSRRPGWGEDFRY